MSQRGERSLRAADCFAQESRNAAHESLHADGMLLEYRQAANRSQGQVGATSRKRKRRVHGRMGTADFAFPEIGGTGVQKK